MMLLVSFELIGSIIWRFGLSEEETLQRPRGYRQVGW